MRRTIPSLSALQAFEAAGRLKSFSLAAAELFVTQGAISRQIRTLEEDLGQKLFERLARSVELTQAGSLYLREIRFALDHMDRATVKFRARQTHSILTLSVLPSVASFWLMPKLAAFSKHHPDIEIRIITSIRPVDLLMGEADIAIRVGALPGKSYEPWQPRIDLDMVSNWRGIHADLLFPDILIPVYSRGLSKDGGVIQSVDDILRFRLIHTSSRAHAWPDWLRAVGAEGPSDLEPIEYGHFFMSLDAAREAEGIAIVPSILLATQQDLMTVKDCPRIPSAGEYYLLVREDRMSETHISAFCTWIKAQAQLDFA